MQFRAISRQQFIGRGDPEALQIEVIEPGLYMTLQDFGRRVSQQNDPWRAG